MIQNNIRRAEELKKITSSIIKLRAEVESSISKFRAELEKVNQALQNLIDKEIQEIEEEDRYWQQQSDSEKESA
tara:strand:+ start:673 stop:894 length:222 start_codon:yes stop_codon:yes gene_type:complete